MTDTKIEPPPLLSKPCKKCGHPYLRGWIAYAEADGFIYHYFCQKCDEPHFLFCADIYRQRENEDKKDKIAEIIKPKLIPIHRIIEKYGLDFKEVCETFSEDIKNYDKKGK